VVILVVLACLHGERDGGPWGGPPFDRLARYGREFGLAFASAQLVHVGLILLSGSGAGMAFFWAGIVLTYLLVLLSLPGTFR
jgi:hypothetical protein